METKIKKHIEQTIQEKIETSTKLYNPEGMDFRNELRIKSIEPTDEYTRIDFIYRSSTEYINGGWIQMEKGAYIQPVNSNVKYGLIKAIGIPIAPAKHYFNRQGEYHTYTLIFPALPKNTRKINIIEKEAPGNYFNFYDIDYSTWMTVPHAADLPVSEN
jgi:hypothetical protein